MSKLSTIKAMVFEELVEHQETRNDDFVMILNIYNKHFEMEHHSFYDVMKNHSRYGLPSFESIRRARQKVQEEHPELRATKQIEDGRYYKQEDYIRFAREGR